jgi:hypothetical protein
MEMNNYSEINKMLANLSLREETTENVGSNRTQETNYEKSSKNVENVFARDLNFYQKNTVRDIEMSVNTRMSKSKEVEKYPDTNKLLNERGFMPNSSVFPAGSVNNNINVVREDMPLSTRVISSKKQYTNE